MQNGYRSVDLQPPLLEHLGESAQVHTVSPLAAVRAAQVAFAEEAPLLE